MRDGLPSHGTPSPLTINDILPEEPPLVPVKRACWLGSFGKTRAFELINDGTLRARKAGARTLIETDSLKAYLANLPAVTPRPKKEAA